VPYQSNYQEYIITLSPCKKILGGLRHYNLYQIADVLRKLRNSLICPLPRKAFHKMCMFATLFIVLVIVIRGMNKKMETSSYVYVHMESDCHLESSEEQKKGNVKQK
jgi:hypothetical protein